jgi:vancomycin resistance protein VanW
LSCPAIRVDRGAFDFACSATLSYNYVDLQIKNETAESFQINLWFDDEYLNGEIRSELEPISDYEVFETDHLIKMQWWGGYSRYNKIWKRSTRRTDSFVEEEMVADKHAVMMYGPY